MPDVSQDAKVYYLFPPTQAGTRFLPTADSPPIEPVLPYDEYLLGRGLTEKTAIDYTREIRLASVWFDGQSIDMEVAVPSQLIAYAETRPNTPAVRAHLRSGLRYWWEWRGVRGWPDAIRVPANKPMICKALDDVDARALVKAARGW